MQERLFAVELPEGGQPRLREPRFLAGLALTEVPDKLPAAAFLPGVTGWLNETALQRFLESNRSERRAEIERIVDHIELSFAEIHHPVDLEIGRAGEDADKGKSGAEDRLPQAEARPVPRRV